MGAAKKLGGTKLASVSTGKGVHKAIDALGRTQWLMQWARSLDGAFRIESASEGVFQQSGFSREELISQPLRVLMDETDLGAMSWSTVCEKLASGEDVVGEFRFLHKKGQPRWVCGVFSSENAMSKGARPSSKGPTGSIFFAGMDVTETRKDLDVRKEIMNVTSIVSEADLRGDIVNINEKFCEVSKYGREELIGKPHNTTRHPDMPKEVFKEMWSTIGRGNIFRGVVKNRAKDGNPYYVDAVIAPILGDNGKPKKYLGVRYDITVLEVERQNMAAVLRAIDSAYAYIEFDTSGNVMKANENFLKAMSYTKEQLVGVHHRVFCEKAHAESSDYIHFWQELKQGKSHSGVFKRKRSDGADLWLQAVYAPVADETGRVLKVIKIATDVTAQQRMILAVQETATALSSASVELTATATEMQTTSNKTSQQSQTAAAAAEEVSAGVQTVATNVEEMVASIREIGRSTAESSQMAKVTLDRAMESNATIGKLGKSSQEIGDVIKVISSIAQQTNLLALNATIEAARAGEAGKGFAVVANEVKELAKQTAKATDDITLKIGAIQQDTSSAVEAISGIAQAVERLNGISGVIAAAVEEQTATTNEISRVVVESKTAVESVAETIKTVSMAASESSVSSGQTLSASKELAQLAVSLTALISKST